MPSQLMPRMKSTVKSILMAAGVDFRMKTDDRQVLEGTIIPAVARSPEYHNILFIGCDWYTRGYQREFVERNYWTLEIDPAKSKFGARQHIVDTAENLAQHFNPNSLDFIFCNGVVGWGLDDPVGVERMLSACWDCLRDNGVLMIGWNDVPERRPPVPFAEVAALKKFQPYVFPELGTAVRTTASDLLHTYNFYIKEASG